MRNRLWLFVCIGLAFTLSSGCKKKVTQFYVDYTTEAVIPATLSILPVSVNTPEVTTNSTYNFENNNTRRDHIRHILLDKLSLAITSPQGETFSFVNSVTLYISAPGLEETAVAFADSIPANVGNQLALTSAGVDLKDYIKADQIQLRLKVVTDETIPQDVHISVYSKYLVDAKLIRSKK